MTQREFDKIFSRHRMDESGRRFSLFLACSVFIFMSVIVVISSFDYQDLARANIEDRYINFIISSDYKPRTAETTEELISVPEIKEEKLKTTSPTISEIVEEAFRPSAERTEVQLSRPSPAASAREYSIDKNLDITNELLIRNESGMYVHRSRGLSSVDASLYSIERSADIRIKTPQYLTEKKEARGYRNQEEILNVIYTKSDLIESCYQRQARVTWINKGFIKVQFSISPKGFVLPGSIQIVESSIKNKDLEQCIIKNIRRWREFEKLDSNYGIAKVVHKFIFN